MKTKSFLLILLLIAFNFICSGQLSAQSASPAEKAKIEALISHLENLTDATFTRNSSNYDSKTAAKFLRGKWHAHEKDIKTADDFIAKAATVSSTTGKPYLIRLQGQPQIPCADYLHTQLKELEAAKS